MAYPRELVEAAKRLHRDAGRLLDAVEKQVGSDHYGGVVVAHARYAELTAQNLATYIATRGAGVELTDAEQAEQAAVRA